MAGALGLLPAALARGSRIGAVGITLGALAGLSRLWLPDMASVAAFAGVVYYLIAPAVLQAVVVLTVNDLQSEARHFYTSQAGAAAMLLIETALATGMASLFFYVLALNVPVFLSGARPAHMQQLLLGRIGAGSLLAVLVVTLAGAGAIAAWAQRKAAS